MQKRRYIGRRFLFWGGLALACWSGYELYARLDAMRGPLVMFWNLAVGEGIPVARAMQYVDWEILRVPAYLAGCALLGLAAMLLRNRPMAALLLMPLGALVIWNDVDFTSPGLPAPQHLVKLIPVGLIVVGGLLNLCSRAFHAARREPDPPRRSRFRSAARKRRD